MTVRTRTLSLRADEDLVADIHADASGSDGSRRELTRRYQGLVHNRASRHRARCEADRRDLVSVAQVGLQKAVEQFDRRLGPYFAAYAVARVEGELRNWYRDNRYAVRVPRPLHELHMRVRAAQVELDQHIGHEPSIDELADHLEVDPDDVVAALAVSSAERLRTAQLAAAVVGGDHTNSADLHDAVSRLDERSRLVLYRGFWQGRSQEAIAFELEVSQATVSRVKRRALDALADALTP